ncbi:MAG: tryptophan--tRNA ligase [Candidatus Margulisbacteria bacterium GWF2_35_9]|nr:MAG: tryptophan--tRNA ligase [Candidatus Margulisbacteria bacterium GWF2_35_9]
MKRLLSGIQSTGNMHLGNYFGAVKNWVDMQHDYEAFYMVADLHALTTSYEDGVNIMKNTYEVIADLIACGIDPNKSTPFVQSRIPEHSELHLIFSMITPLPWLERVPTYKSKIEELKGKDLNTYGFLGYPVLQAADIMLYQADVVPVGKDQAPHLELTREVVRRFNHLYNSTFFMEPKEIFTEFPVIPGTDGNKMSKSYGNAIYLSDDAETVTQKIMKMFTDPQRLRRTDPGRPEICPLFAFQEIFNPKETKTIAADCKSAKIGCVDCKKKCLTNMLVFIEPIRMKRVELLNDKKMLDEIIDKGTKRAQKVAHETVNKVKEIIKIK